MKKATITKFAKTLATKKPVPKKKKDKDDY